jgi:hypothetical protein
MSLSELGRLANVNHGTMRRYWFNSKTGLERDEGTLHQVYPEHLRRIAQVLGAEFRDLFEVEQTKENDNAS